MLIRKLLTHERPLYADHLKRLPPLDRQYRFAHPRISDDSIDRYVAGIAADDLVLGAFADNQLIGAVHIAFAGDLAELGVSVDTRQRQRGLGEELFRRAIRWARNRRAERLYTLCQADNRAMMALATKAGMEIHRESGTAEAYLPLSPPDFLTMSDEVAIGMHVAMHDWAELMRATSFLAHASH
jgi:RimJ/RimL family protein N-acetyltransferase